MNTGIPRSLGFRTDLALLRLGTSTVDEHDDCLVVRSPHNPGFWWGNFLLLRERPAPGSVPHWLERFATELPDATHRTFGVDTVDGQVDDLAEFADAGFRTEASAVLTAQAVREPVRVDGPAELRPLGSNEDWAQSSDLRMRCDADESHLSGHRDFVVAKTVTNRRLVDDGHARWFGAFIGGLLVSQLGLVRVDDELARYQTVETDPAFRRRGLAGALLHRAGRWALDELGARTLVIVADPEYVAIDLYRKVGFVQTESELQAELRPSG